MVLTIQIPGQVTVQITGGGETMRNARPLSVIGAKARWDRLNTFTLATKLNVAQTEAFDAACEARGITRYEALRRFCCAVIAKPETLDKRTLTRYAK